MALFFFFLRHARLNANLSLTGGGRLTPAALLKAQKPKKKAKKKQELVAAWWVPMEENIKNLSRFLL